MPFFEEQIRWIAKSQVLSGICDASKIVPTVTVNCLRQTAHFQRPLRAPLLDPSFGSILYALTAVQCGHVTPSFQRRLSSSSRAFSASEKCLAKWLRSIFSLIA